jgi:transmembrane sensor
MNIQDPYINYSVEDFLWDEKFRRDLLNPQENNAFWENWVQRHPEKKQVVEDAKKIILSLSVDEAEISEDEIQFLISDTAKLLDSASEANVLPVSKPGIISRYKYALALAATLLVIFLIYSLSDEVVQLPFVAKKDAYDRMIVKSGVPLTERINLTNAPMIIELEDGTKITLEKKSKISFTKNISNAAKREVYLTGEAFFDVARDPQHPFLVYANGLVTKVLGTSFRIRSYENEKNVTVDVSSGKVSVFANPDKKTEIQTESPELSSIVLTPNQRVSYTVEDASFIKTIVNNPVKISDTVQTDRFFHFTDAPVNEVFSTIRNTYGIEVVYDEVALSHCTLTANLDDYSLFEQLTIICKALNGSYEVLDGKIIVTAKGCE